jgi:hypothetical protein
MEKFTLSIALFLLLFCDTAKACTVTIKGLRQEFRQSSQVFTGEFVEFDDGSTYEIPTWLAEKWKPDTTLGKVTFSIKKAGRVGDLETFHCMSTQLAIARCALWFLRKARKCSYLLTRTV